jgi:hypothetical protein
MNKTLTKIYCIFNCYENNNLNIHKNKQEMSATEFFVISFLTGHCKLLIFPTLPLLSDCFCHKKEA